MNDLALTLIGAALVNNLVLTRLLGFHPFPDGERRVSSALALSLMTGFLIALATPLCYLIEHAVLVPHGLDYLRVMAFIIVIVTLSQLTDRLMRSITPALHAALGVTMPLIAINGVVLGATILNATRDRSFADSVFFGLGTSLGFILVLGLFSALRERLQIADPPTAFQGDALMLLTAGLTSLGFMGFAGLVPP